jgi:hypothetical protein
MLCLEVVEPDPIRETRPTRLDSNPTRSDSNPAEPDLTRPVLRSNDFQSNRNLSTIWKNTTCKFDPTRPDLDPTRSDLISSRRSNWSDPSDLNPTPTRPDRLPPLIMFIVHFFHALLAPLWEIIFLALTTSSKPRLEFLNFFILNFFVLQLEKQIKWTAYVIDRYALEINNQTRGRL